jgi:hypothetical protein
LGGLLVELKEEEKPVVLRDGGDRLPVSKVRSREIPLVVFAIDPSDWGAVRCGGIDNFFGV